MKTSSFAKALPSEDGVSPELRQGLLAIADGECGSTDLQAMSCRSERLLLRAGDWVLKVHSEDTCAKALQQRLELTTRAGWKEIVLEPATLSLRTLTGGRSVTVWPLGRALRLEDEDLPWEESARLLAALHRLPLGETAELPRSRALPRWFEAVKRLEAAPADVRDQDWHLIQKASATLDLKLNEEKASHWVHGDWHLGQLVDIGCEGKPVWRLIDIEDMGVGEAIWDLARPAAFFAAGLLPQDDWERFIAAYRRAEGAALPPAGDVWKELEKPARALVVQSAATSWLKAKREGRGLHQDEQVLVKACLRIVHTNHVSVEEQLSS